MNDLTKLAEILDEHIEKGLAIEKSRKPYSQIDAIEESIVKGMSHNPFSPHDMQDDSPYYNPYARHQDGGYYPHTNESWALHGRQSDITTDAFYRVAGDEPMDARPQVKLESLSQFARFSKSFMNTLQKGGPVPVGTVHTHTDGQAYKKVAEGKWVATVGLESKKTQKYLEHKDPKVRAQASHGIEQTAAKKQKIEEMIKQRTREQAIINQAKDQAVQAAAAHTKNVMGTMYDGKPPKALDQMTNDHIKQHGYKPTNPKEILEQHGKGLQPKTHNVKVGFTHQGKEYTHSFEGVHAAHHEEAIKKVQELLKQKLPGHQLTSVRAETPKQPKVEAKKSPVTKSFRTARGD